MEEMYKSLLVTIPKEQYEQLLSLKTRVSVAIERARHDRFIKIEDILWILGTEFSIVVAEEIEQKKNEDYKRISEMNVRAEVTE